MADMIKFFKGLEASLPASGVNGALYITTDEGAIYLGTGTGMKRLGDFVQVDNVASLPAKAHESCLYYCVAENILAKWNGAEWKQINKQPTAEELKGLLGLGSVAYINEVGEDNLSTALKEKVKAFVGERTSFRLLIQMQGVEFIDSSGLGMLISWYKLANERESKIVYCCIDDYVRKIMGIAKLDKILPLAENKAQAKEMLA